VNKQVALALWSKAQEVATHYSNPDRSRNQGAETFIVESADRPPSMLPLLRTSNRPASAHWRYSTTSRPSRRW
jgi:hypothetical protein